MEEISDNLEYQVQMVQISDPPAASTSSADNSVQETIPNPETETVAIKMEVSIGDDYSLAGGEKNAGSGSEQADGGSGLNENASSKSKGRRRSTSGGAAIPRWDPPAGKPFLFGDEMKFMSDFDPSRRVTQKLSKKFTKFGTVVEEKCDCLIPDCIGCHYPCETCGSRKCGPDCKRGREWEYESLVVQGRDIIRTQSGIKSADTTKSSNS